MVSFSSFLLPLRAGLLLLLPLQLLLRPLHPQLSCLPRRIMVPFSSFSIQLFLLLAQAMVADERVPPDHRRSWQVGQFGQDGTRRTKC